MRRPEITLALFPSEKEESINSFNPVFLQFYSALFGLARPCSSPASGYGGRAYGLFEQTERQTGCTQVKEGPLRICISITSVAAVHLRSNEL